jgi:hypothetical protein
MAKIKAEAEKEAVLLALDQLSQTMDVMRQVVGRLKRSIESAEPPPKGKAQPRPQESTDEDECEKEIPSVLH